MSSVPSTDTVLKAEVVYRSRPGVVERIALKGPDVLLGSEPGAGVLVAAKGVSRRHARITFDGKNHWLEGLSPAGTFLNGRLVRRERLRSFDVITLGRRIELLFLLGGQEIERRQGIVRVVLVAESGEQHEVPLGEVTIGRSSSTNIPLDARAVSNVHAVVQRTGRHLMIRDASSSNGTFVNGQRVSTAMLRDGDLVSLGNVVQLKVICETGEVRSSGQYAVPNFLGELEKPADEPKLSRSWKTRYDWDSGELLELNKLHEKLAAREAAKKKGKTTGLPVAKPEKPAKRAPAPEAKPAAPRPAAPAPAAAVKPAAPAPAPASAPAAAVKRPAPASSASAPGAKPAAPPAAAAAPPDPAVAPKPPVPPPTTSRPTGPASAAPVSASAAKRTAPAPEAKPAAPTPAAPASAAAVKPAAPAPTPASAPAVKRPAPASSPGTKPAAPPAAAAAPPAPAVAPKPPVPPPTTSRPTGPASAAPVPTPPSASLTPAAPKEVSSPAVATAGPIAEVRLTGVETDLLISLPGRHEVGRAHEVSLRVNNPTVSRRHAAIVLSDDRMAVHVEHLGASNGTYLNGVELAIMKPTPVVDGDVVRFGDLELKIGLKRL